MDNLERKAIEQILDYPLEINYLNRAKRFADMAPYNRTIIEEYICRCIIFWRFPTIDSTYYSLKLLYTIYNRNGLDNDLKKEIEKFLKNYKDNILDYISNCFDKKRSGFLLTRRELIQKNNYPTFYSFKKAIEIIDFINLIEDLFNLKKNEYNIFRNNFNPYFNVRYDKKSGGFLENPNNKNQDKNNIFIPSIFTTANAILCYQNLGLVSGEEFFLFDKKSGDEKEKVLKFIKSKRINKDDWTAYYNSKNEKYPAVSSTYYALKAYEGLKKKKSKMHIIRLLRFLIHTKQKKSGFSLDLNFNSNILHTNIAIRIINKYYYCLKEIETIDGRPFNYFKFLENTFQDVVKLLKESSYKSSFTFTGINCFLPNIFATYLAYEIKDSILNIILKEPRFKKPKTVFLNESDTVNFLFSCFRSSEGAFRGFSYSSDYITDQYFRFHYGYKRTKRTKRIKIIKK